MTRTQGWAAHEGHMLKDRIELLMVANITRSEIELELQRVTK